MFLFFAFYILFSELSLPPVIAHQVVRFGTRLVPPLVVEVGTRPTKIVSLTVGGRRETERQHGQRHQHSITSQFRYLKLLIKKY